MTSRERLPPPPTAVVLSVVLSSAGFKSAVTEASRTSSELHLEAKPEDPEIQLFRPVDTEAGILCETMPESRARTEKPPGVQHNDREYIVNADGQKLFCRYWEPESPPRALVFLAHGAGEHSGGYHALAHSLTRQSLMVFAHDHVGHGRSEGQRMVVRDFQVFIRDSLQHIDFMMGRYPGLPVFLVGHSMGGAIVILTACERPSDFSGVVLIAPMVQMNPESATPFKVFVAKLLNHVVPNLCLGSIDSKWISRDQREVEAYDADELNHHGGMCVSFGMQLMGAARQIEKTLPAITWPFLLLHGDADKLCDIRGSQLMFEKVQSTDKKLKVYNGAYHALHHDLPETVESVLMEMSIWIVERIPVQPQPNL